MKKNILVCGASGFVGTNICKRLMLNKNFRIYAIYFSNKPKIKYNKNIIWIRSDLRQLNNCLKLTKNKDIIIQCAATTSGSNDILLHPYLHVTDNAVMNSYLLKASYVNNVKHFIFTSCTVMYPHSNKPLTETEFDEKKIFTSYYGVAHTKLYVEKISKFFSDISDTKFTIIRHSNLYGPYDKFDIKKGHFIGSSIKKIFDKDKSVKINGPGEEKRDFLYIDDFLDFLDKVIRKQHQKFQIFNCTYGRSFSVVDVLSRLIKLSGVKKKIVHYTNRKNINVNILVSSRKAEKQLGWRPFFTLNRGLKKTIQWYKNEIN